MVWENQSSTSFLPNHLFLHLFHLGMNTSKQTDNFLVSDRYRNKQMPLPASAPFHSSAQSREQGHIHQHGTLGQGSKNIINMKTRQIFIIHVKMAEAFLGGNVSMFLQYLRTEMYFSFENLNSMYYFSSMCRAYKQFSCIIFL